MGIVNLLSEETINKIAAGEVVDRPASIVKELVENSIDAGATAITVEIKNGGILYLRITDNGCGIAKEDVAKAFLRHATSKIKDAKDLERICSLGFRGEALSSIGAISHVELLTKRAEDMLGTRYTINGGVEESLTPVGCPNGTTFLIRDVFYNVPARKKFLKSAQTEANYITDLMYRLALSHPEISFSFLNQGRNALYTSGNGKLRDTIYSIYGREIATNLVEVDESFDRFRLHGFLGKPVIARGNRGCENYYLNGRYIQNKMLSRAIEDGYKNFMMQHKFPFTCLFFEFPADAVDINVHPSKMEARIEHGEEIYECVRKTVQEALRHSMLMPGVDFEHLKQPTQATMSQAEQLQEKNAPTEGMATPGKELSSQAALMERSRQTEPIKAGQEAEPASGTVPIENKQQAPASKGMSGYETFGRPLVAAETIPYVSAPEKKYEEHKSALPVSKPAADKELSKERPPEVFERAREALRTSQESVLQITDIEQQTLFTAEGQKLAQQPQYTILGQAFGTYWLVQKDNQLYFIDQHAAHEKIIYERMVEAYRKRNVVSQLLMPAKVISLSPQEEEALRKYETYFGKLGFSVSHFGAREYLLEAVPMDLYGLCEEDFFTAVLNQLLDTPVFGPSDQCLEKIASMSCKAAIKGNTKLSTQEAKALIDELMTLENPFHCPHGRPVIITMSKYEMEKRFRRIV